MGSRAASLLYLVVIIAVVVGVDWRFLRRHLWWRLTVNAGIVLVFLAVYWVFVH
jgi:type IV secretory pathway VirB2 component (pilin)